MVIGIFGESCTGKSTLADALRARYGAAVYTGKDYLKLAKNEQEAASRFAALLRERQDAPEWVVYVISEKEQLAFLPENAPRVHCIAPIEAIKARFAERMHGHMPPPVERMLESKHGMFDIEPCTLRVDTTGADAEAICDQLEAVLG